MRRKILVPAGEESLIIKKAPQHLSPGLKDVGPGIVNS